MKQILETWNKFLKQGRTLNEMRYIERMFLPSDFLASLPPEVREKVDEYDVLDFAFEEYKSIFPQYNLGGINPVKFFVPYAGHELFFDYSASDDHNIIRQPTEQERLEKNKTIPVLPNKWFNAFLKHYKTQMIERKVHNQIMSQAKILAVFDFDDTLFKSSLVDQRLGVHSPMDPKSIPEKPLNSDWNLEIVLKAQELCSNPNVLCVMMTGRADEIFRNKIDKILKQRNLLFFETFYKPPNIETAQFKIDRIYDFFDRMPQIEKLVMWDDDAEKIQAYTQEFQNKIDFEIHHVRY